MQKWEYLFLETAFANEVLHPFKINGKMMDDWKSMSNIYEFSNKLGSDGWELCGTVPYIYEGITHGNKSPELMIFKRQK